MQSYCPNARASPSTHAKETVSTNNHQVKPFSGWKQTLLASSFSPRSLPLCTTSSSVFFPTSLPIFQAVKTCPCWKISSISSSVRPTVSGYMKNTWMNPAKLNVPKIKYVFHAIEASPGGTAHASEKLNNQLVAYSSQMQMPME